MAATASARKQRRQKVGRPAVLRVSPSDPATIAGLIADRLKPLAALAVPALAIASFLGVITAFYTWTGLPLPVSDRALKTTIEGVTNDVGTKLAKTKDEVVAIGAKNTAEVKDDVAGVKKQIESLSKDTRRATQTALEGQRAAFFGSKTQALASLASVEQRLRENSADAAAIQRKAELDNLIKLFDRQLDAIDADLRRLRNE